MANFWWVIQNGSYQHDLQLGILWAPLRDKAGHRKSHWESLDRVQPGDVVFHYAGQMVKAVSCVSRGSMPASRPYEGGEAWHKDGRCVQTRYAELDAPLPLSEIPLELRKAAVFKGSAFKAGGGANEGYLFDLPTDFGVWLSERLNLLGEPDTNTARDGDSPNDDNSPPAASAYFDETDRKVVVDARREQPTLRDFLFKSKSFSTCAICGRYLPVQLLTTAHIKPRKHCDTIERNDPYVVMAACTLGCDALFEKHFIVVDETGTIQRGWREGTDDVAAAVTAVSGRACAAFTSNTSAYFDSHRFLKTELVGSSV
ncbi:hypothetical protein ABIB17_000476 [Arthrobacter sp. UYEF6]